MRNKGIAQNSNNNENNICKKEKTKEIKDINGDYTGVSDNTFYYDMYENEKYREKRKKNSKHYYDYNTYKSVGEDNPIKELLNEKINEQINNNGLYNKLYYHDNMTSSFEKQNTFDKNFNTYISRNRNKKTIINNNNIIHGSIIINR